MQDPLTMKKNGILNHEISGIVAAMGHMDMLVIADAGLPVPENVKRIDLAIAEGIPPFIKTLETVLTELKVQEALIAVEVKSKSPELYRSLVETLGDIPVRMITHEDFKKTSAGARAVIRTGEFTPYANVILVSGVVF